MAEVPHGSRLGIDWGKARIGVAACGAGTTFAYPVETVKAGLSAVGRLAELVAAYEAPVVYVGLPLNLKGERSFAAQWALERAAELAASVPGVEVRLVDERMSTAAASRTLSGAGRSQRSQRQVIDQAAAVDILQRALDVEQATGALAGEVSGMEEE